MFEEGERESLDTKGDWCIKRRLFGRSLGFEKFVVYGSRRNLVTIAVCHYCQTGWPLKKAFIKHCKGQ